MTEIEIEGDNPIESVRRKAEEPANLGLQRPPQAHEERFDLVGRCPTCGQAIMALRTTSRAPRTIRSISWSCLCPGRVDGVYASAFGYELVADTIPLPAGPSAAEERAVLEQVNWRLEVPKGE